MEQIKNDLITVLNELYNTAKPEQGDILVVGCSTSEVLGKKIGSSGSEECAQIIASVILDFCVQKNLYLAAQCCEHLNRCLVVEKTLAKQKGLTIVCAVPQLHAGGAFGTTVYKKMKEPVLVEEVSAQLGIDIGNTLIGMHLQKVAVPVRVSLKYLGEAPIVLARTRPKYIGGERAKYK